MVNSYARFDLYAERISMAGSVASPELLSTLHNKATQLRINSVRATSEAGSGHPSSCASAADIVAALFFSVMRYDPQNPK
ncbi:MAG: hypothetical protein ACXW4A_04335, partial [Nitrospira sp.]